jgi:hypothetical protein
MAEKVLEGLMLIDAATIQAAEKSHVLLTVGNVAGPDGRVAVQMSDIKANYGILKPVLQKLDGRQPTSAMYCSAMHALDKASLARCSDRMPCKPVLCP